MPELIDLVRKILGRLTTRRLFAFTPEYWGRERVEPQKMRSLQTFLGSLLGVRLFTRAYPGISGRVHIHDSMLLNDSPEEIAHYIKVGRSAMSNIEESLALAGLGFQDIGACLDLACGYGRVLRLLRQKIDPARITACDIEAEAVRFCQAEFGVRPLRSQVELRKVTFPHRYDLIWVGSLFTHLEPAAGLDLLRILVDLIKDKGLLIFSTQGATCLDHIPFYGFMFVEREAQFRKDMAEKGFAYSAYYGHTPNYGIALYRRDYLEQEMTQTFAGRARLARFKERGWDDHQDVWTYQRIG